MIDIHSHILPGMDDGTSKHEQFIEMAKSAVNVGITHLFATPHHLNGHYVNPKFKILEHVSNCSKLLKEANIPLTLLAGQELRIHREIFLSLQKDEVLTLDNKGKHLLLELPSMGVPNYTYEVVYELLLKDITPIIVHPERNKGFIEDPNILFEFVQEGALTQLTSGSILGQYGKKIKNFSERLIEHQLTHFIASDAHNSHARGFSLPKAYEMITSLYGIEKTFYFRENAELLLSGQSLLIEKPIVMRKRLFGVF